jgi:putative SOS response-associated peptidase YedK
MPVIVADELVDDWLSKSVNGTDIVAAVLTASTAESDKLSIHEVRPLKGDGPQLSEAIADSPDLFSVRQSDV